MRSGSYFRIFVWICLAYVSASLWFLVFWSTSTPAIDRTGYQLEGVYRLSIGGPTADVVNETTIGRDTCNMTRLLEANAGVCHKLVNLPRVKGHISLQSHVGYHKREMYEYCDVTSVMDDCVKVKHAYLYGKENIKQGEANFPLAFAIKLHDTANQAHRLLRYIYREHNVYCIHVDKKSPDLVYEYFVKIAACFDNIVVIMDRVNLVYSTIRQVEAEFRCVDAMLSSNVPWRYYINLTGREFMLKTNAEIVNILKLLKGRNDIESYPMVTDSHKYKQKTLIMRNKAFISKLSKAPFDRNITIRKGSAYGMFSRSFLEFVKYDTIANEFVEWLADAYAPEEMIWATLNTLDKAPGGSKTDITQTDGKFLSRAVIWSIDRKYRCRGMFVRWVCIYGMGDLPWLVAHRNVVANKFYENYQPLTLDCLEWYMYGRLQTMIGKGEEFDENKYIDLVNI